MKRPVDAAAPSSSPAAPAPRTFKANRHDEALFDIWHDQHVAAAAAEKRKELARDAAVARFDELDADVIISAKYGPIARLPRVGQVDYKRLALEQLGAARLEELEESYRKPGTNPPTAPNAWSAEAAALVAATPANA